MNIRKEFDQHWPADGLDEVKKDVREMIILYAEALAEDVRAEEREACAKLAETPLCASDIDDYVVPTQEAIARLIRARK